MTDARQPHGEQPYPRCSRLGLPGYIHPSHVAALEEVADKRAVGREIKALPGRWRLENEAARVIDGHIAAERGPTRGGQLGGCDGTLEGYDWLRNADGLRAGRGHHERDRAGYQHGRPATRKSPHPGLLSEASERPEIRGEIRVEQVGVRHREVTRIAPALAPGIAHRESLGGVLVADPHDRVAAERALPRARHLNRAAMSHLLRLERLVDGEAEDERIAIRDARAQRTRVLDDALVRDRTVLLRIRVGVVGRALRELRDVVGPVGLGRRALVCEHLEPVPDHRARVLVDGALDLSLAVVDEEPARRPEVDSLLGGLEFVGGSDRVASTAAQLALVKYRWQSVPHRRGRR